MGHSDSFYLWIICSPSRCKLDSFETVARMVELLGTPPAFFLLWQVSPGTHTHHLKNFNRIEHLPIDGIPIWTYPVNISLGAKTSALS